MIAMQPTAVSRSPCTPASTPRKRRTRSSASSACIGPDEDWTKVSDFGERRRLQSRIAQRIYRMKQKEQREQMQKHIQESEPSTPDLTTTSASDLSCTHTQLPGLPNVFDMPTPNMPEQPCSPLTSNIDTILQPELPNVFDMPTPNMSEQPCSPLTSNIDSILPLESSIPPLSAPQTLCAHVSIPSTSSCFQQPPQPPHVLFSDIPRGVPQPHSQHLSYHSTAYPPHVPRQFASPGPRCACAPAVYHPPPQRMHSCHGRMLPTGLEDYNRAPYRQFDPSLSIDLASPYAFSSNRSSSCMALPTPPPPLPPKRGCCCCHHHGHPPASETGHRGGFDGYATHPYTGGTRGGLEHAAWPFLS